MSLSTCKYIGYKIPAQDKCQINNSVFDLKILHRICHLSQNIIFRASISKNVF